jgi:hypothetical protein
MLAADALVEEARQATGLEDFGEGPWRDGLERLVDALAREADLTPLGETVLAYRIRTLLGNRLRVERCYRDHPEIARTPIEGPLVVIGLPRTGTTALSNLLAADPATRPLRLYESQDPVPPPEAGDEDPRIARTQAGLEAMCRGYPAMRYLYPQTATGPTECQDLLGMSFRAIHFDGMARVPSYAAWVRDLDMRPAYRYHSRVLRLLGFHAGPYRWHLKTPVHMLALDAFLETYPGALFFWTHRDPTEAIASVASLIAYLRRMTSERSDPEELGAQQLALWEEATRRALAVRDRIGEERFADVSFGELAADGVATVRAAYERLGLPFTPEAEAGMRRWLEANRRGAHGVHRYDPAAFGLTREAVRRCFDFYLERFGGLAEGETR